MNKDLISGIVLFAVAGLYYHFTGDIADSTLSDEVGATGLPVILAALLAILAVLLIGRSLVVARPRAAVAAGDGDEAARPPRALGFLLFGAAYIVLLPLIGYGASIALLIAGIALYEGAARNWVVPAAAVGGAVLYWAVFVKLLGVNQPLGILLQGLMP
ncbi:tripartite tricarboxylate transporter TctB family protein [Chelatococcus sp. GCM10030263]|uniref:tripartite tricarboxylate transporter TctB family protein n=1 Tax=Chelatococcus sp. GCM10030263 TaxID=3273387 RepID=UPI003616BCE0